MSLVKNRINYWRQDFIALAIVGLAGCSSQTSKAPIVDCPALEYSVSDPAEPVNRKIFAFNSTVDDYFLAPVARGYRRSPSMVQTGVHNFAANFQEPKVFINDLLQGNFRRSINTVGRFALNTTVGLVGLIDVSGKVGIERHTSDFGQTFGVWGVGAGPTVELPFFGTSNSRDATGKVLSFFVAPLGDSDTISTLSTVNTVAKTVDGRATVLPLTDSLQKLPDYYSALRNTVAQDRANYVAEGQVGAANIDSKQCTKSAQDDF